MHATSAHENLNHSAGNDSPAIRSRTRAKWLTGCCLLAASALTLAAGCAEFVHEGHISDGANSSIINDVRIDQQQSDGTWKHLGDTDGRGRWWIMKKDITGGGRVRLSKSGYYTVVMSESEFLQGSNLVLMPIDGGDDFSTPRNQRGASDWPN